MQILVNTDHNVSLSTASETEITSSVAGALTRFENRVTRVEVHLKDESAGRSTGNDIQCRLEARPEGRGPEATTYSADSAEAAARGAAQKMANRLETVFGKIDHRRGSSSMGDGLAF